MGNQPNQMANQYLKLKSLYWGIATRKHCRYWRCTANHRNAQDWKLLAGSIPHAVTWASRQLLPSKRNALLLTFSRSLLLRLLGWSPGWLTIIRFIPPLTFFWRGRLLRSIRSRALHIPLLVLLGIPKIMKHWLKKWCCWLSTTPWGNKLRPSPNLVLCGYSSAAPGHRYQHL